MLGGLGCPEKQGELLAGLLVTVRENDDGRLLSARRRRMTSRRNHKVAPDGVRLGLGDLGACPYDEDLDHDEERKNQRGPEWWGPWSQESGSAAAPRPFDISGGVQAASSVQTVPASPVVGTHAD